MNNVFTFDPQARATEERKAELLAVLEEIKGRIESGEIKEFVACSMDQDGTANIHVSALDLPGSIGLFEIGKHILIQLEV